ncbi:ISAs1 family transposase [Xenorhabdus bovienii]|nr:ISAs1 family transposase [Xenorhabdus bovienii]MDE9430926.1 ISAs1 family transposase [Xenorhabdus bovienii]MDE9440365.1 ISAs1 family transposase [Xenorhabdus bovienii]MDE9488570.1 ISAs1 family transposase [Xenorhabdus bovienii]MDE9504950.1 ISAs1 family transposase [Xenorhabdus bovienii]
MDKSGKESLKYHYYISSAALNKEQFKQAVRSHCLIENSLHWVLYVTMNEDTCRIYRENAAENRKKPGCKQIMPYRYWKSVSEQVGKK